MHKDGWVEKELERIVSNYLKQSDDPRYFQMLVAEALLILLKRTKP